MQKIRTLEDEQLIIDYYSKGYSARRINEEVLNNKFKTEKSIADVLRKYGIVTRKTKDYYKNCNESSFINITTEEQAYFLGFLQADGWLSSKNNEVGVGSKDQEIIIQFKDFIKTDNKIVNRPDFYQLTIKNEVLHNSLEKYKISSKLYGQFIPNLPEDLLWHYIRGLFDGDGTICVTKEGYLRLNFVGGIQSMAQLSYIIAKETNTEPVPAIINKNNIAIIQYGSSDIICKICNKMYDKATISLNRKRQIAEKYCGKSC